jgi:hypothetical protein
MQADGQAVAFHHDVPFGGYARPRAPGFIASFFAFT